MVVRELLLGPKRFTDLREGLPHVSADVLAQRLRELDGAGVLRRRKLAPPAASQVYELTDWGRELEPVVIALGRWGARAPAAPPEDAAMSLDAHVISLRTLFDPDLAGDLDMRLELRLGDHTFSVEVVDGRIEIVRGEAPAADATIETDPGTLIALLHGRRELAAALREAEIEIEGDQLAAARFLGLFPLPAPAVVPAGV